jgi:hypothetical protein
MKNSIERPAGKVLSDVYSQMSNRKAPELVKESVEVPKKEVEVPKKTEIVSEGSSPEYPQMSSKFSSVFEDIMSGRSSDSLHECYGDKDCKKCKDKKGKRKMYKEMDEMSGMEGGDMEGGEEMDYSEEEEMISVPKSLLRELQSYLGDDMPETDIGDIDFEEVEEGVSVGGTGVKDGTPKTVGSKGSNVASTTRKTVSNLRSNKGGAKYFGTRKNMVGTPSTVKDGMNQPVRKGSQNVAGQQKVGDPNINS